MKTMTNSILESAILGNARLQCPECGRTVTRSHLAAVNGCERVKAICLYCDWTQTAPAELPPPPKRDLKAEITQSPKVAKKRKRKPAPKPKREIVAKQPEPTPAIVPAFRQSDCICLECGSDTRVIDSRPSSDNGIRRRRECLKCLERFTTYEYREGQREAILKAIVAENNSLRAAIASLDRIQSLVDRTRESATPRVEEAA